MNFSLNVRKFFRKCPQIFPKISTNSSENVHKCFREHPHLDFSEKFAVKIVKKMFILRTSSKMSANFCEISLNFSKIFKIFPKISMNLPDHFRSFFRPFLYIFKFFENCHHFSEYFHKFKRLRIFL